jgi:hypothetical protein
MVRPEVPTSRTASLKVEKGIAWELQMETPLELCQELFRTITTQRFRDLAAAAVISALWSYALVIWTFAVTSPGNLLVVLFGILVLSIIDVRIADFAQARAESSWLMEQLATLSTAMAYVLVIALAIGLAAFVEWTIYLAGRFLLNTYDRWWFVPVLLILTWALFVMRVKVLLLYAALEILVGVVAITSSISHAIDQPAQSNQSIALILAVLGGIYIVIRGLDNADKSIRTLPHYTQLAPVIPATKLYLRLRVLWECYITARERSVAKVLKVSVGEWKRAQVERVESKRAREVARKEWTVARARKRNRPRKHPGIGIDLRNFAILALLVALALIAIGVGQCHL